MPNEETNLLPLERRRAFRRGYFIRLSVVVVWLLTALALAAIILLIPAFVFLSRSAEVEKARLAALTAAASSSDEQALSSRLVALSHQAATLSTLAQAPSPSSVVRAFLAVPRPGVVLSGFSYAPLAKGGATLVISGTALTRDALRNYQLALQGAPSVRSVDLPVSAYAKDADIPFTITIKLAP